MTIANLKNQIISGSQNKVQGSGSMWDDFQFGTPAAQSFWLEDFFYWDTDETEWDIDDVGANTRAPATSAPTAGGVLLVTLANADNNKCTMQKIGHSFVPTKGKNLWFECRFQMSEVTQSEVLVGLVVTDTTPLTNTDGIYFRKDDGDVSLDFESNVSSVASSDSAIHSMVADEYVTVGFKVTGTEKIEYYVNGVKKGEVDDVPTVPLRPTFHIQDGDTGGTVGAQTGSIDYMCAGQTR